MSPIPSDLGVAPDYRHAPKQMATGVPVELPDAFFKWYLLGNAERPVPAPIDQLARTHIATAASEARGLGFVILHRCGTDFYFLLVSTWRNENELWETVWYKNGDAMAEFALFPRDGAHKPTFCVWELAAVWHEVQAWNRFLATGRDAAAVEAWRTSQYTGPA